VPFRISIKDYDSSNNDKGVFTLSVVKTKLKPICNVITEISSAQGDKELCIISIEKQSFMAQGSTPQHIKRAKTIQSWLKN
jgi:hypothetical protein